MTVNIQQMSRCEFFIVLFCFVFLLFVDFLVVKLNCDDFSKNGSWSD